MQILDFLAAGAKTKKTFEGLLTRSQSSFKIVKQQISASSLSSRSSSSRSPSASTPDGLAIDEKLWSTSRIRDFAIALVEEIENTINPVSLQRWLRRYDRTVGCARSAQTSAENDKDSVATDKLTLLRFFNVTAWLSPQIPDHADIGAYSQSVTASVYKIAAQNMPRLIVMAAFGQEEVKVNMQYFMEQLERAERTLTQADVAMLDNIMAKDRGPFLYWLLNERFPSEDSRCGQLSGLNRNPLCRACTHVLAEMMYIEIRARTHVVCTAPMRTHMHAARA